MADDHEEFADAALKPQRGLLRELGAFLNESKKWWLLPIIIACLVLGVLIIIANSPAAPFIYTLF